MQQILVDSNFLYSLYSPKDHNHQRSQDWAKMASGESLVPSIVLTEVAFLFRREAGVPAVAAFLTQFAATKTPLLPVLHEDLQRASEIMSAYATANLDFVDCTLMALSERLNITHIATYDRRDFPIFRPRHCDYLELLP